MSFNTSFQFHDLTKLPDSLIDVAIGIIIQEILTRTGKFSYRRIRKIDFRKNLGWFRTLSHIGSAITFMSLQSKFSKIHLKSFAKICNRIMIYNIGNGIKIFAKTEPELFEKIAKFLMTLDTDYRIYKTTGIKSAFLQKHLPNLT